MRKLSYPSLSTSHRCFQKHKLLINEALGILHQMECLTSNVKTYHQSSFTSPADATKRPVFSPAVTLFILIEGKIDPWLTSTYKSKF
jgi:hypothetical protein